jgi:hypothetical protein
VEPWWDDAVAIFGPLAAFLVTVGVLATALALFREVGK